jgi:drug/metabolite transporter (DMT)-like permease
MATVALAIVIVKPILGNYPLMLLSAIRMAGGITVLLPMLLISGERKSVLSAFRPQSAWKWMFCGTFFGSYLSLLCWLGGFKYSHADVAAVLNQMSTVFIVVLASLLLKEPMTRMKLAAVGIALLGAIIVIYR